MLNYSNSYSGWFLLVAEIYPLNQNGDNAPLSSSMV